MSPNAPLLIETKSFASLTELVGEFVFWKSPKLMRANREDEENGRFFQDRFKAVRLLDEASLLACAAYVDLNPIRAALAEALETSDHTSLQRRIESLRDERSDAAENNQQPNRPPTPREPVIALRGKADRFLAPLSIDEQSDATGRPSKVDAIRSHLTHRRFGAGRRVRELLPAAA